jgi:hypothetical protein
MELIKKVLRFAVAVASVLVGCVLISAVLGLALEAVNWVGSESGLWSLIHSFFVAIGNAPGASYIDAFVEETGISTAWLSYLLAMIVLALFGFLRGRK